MVIQAKVRSTAQRLGWTWKPRHGVRGTHRLRVDQPCGRLGVAAVGLADLHPQRVVDALDGPVVVPPGEIPVHSRPGRQVLGQVPPLAAGPGQVQDRIHDPPTRVLLPATALAARPRLGQQGLDQRPLLIGQIRRVTVPTSTHTPPNEPPERPTRRISDTL
jgi:hypothetical protein